MKQLNMYFEDEDYELMNKIKKDIKSKSWKDYVMTVTRYYKDHNNMKRGSKEK